MFFVFFVFYVFLFVCISWSLTNTSHGGAAQVVVVYVCLFSVVLVYVFSCVGSDFFIMFSCSCFRGVLFFLLSYMFSEFVHCVFVFDVFFLCCCLFCVFVVCVCVCFSVRVLLCLVGCICF